MTSSAGSIVIVGSINIDQLVTVSRLPLTGETLFATTMAFLPGGKGANQAVAAARRGASVTMVAAVGDDINAARAMELLVSSGVDVSRVAIVKGPTGLALVTADAVGENTIVVVPGANAAMDGDLVGAHAQIIADAAVVVLQGEIPQSGIQAALAACTGRVVLNLAPVISLDLESLRRADPLVVNEHEARQLLGLLKPEITFPMDDRECAQEIRKCGVTSVVVTLGARGAVICDRIGTTSVPSPKVVALDSSGAGDAFVGALSASLARGVSLRDSVTDAVKVGAFAVQSLGTQASYPMVSDVLPEIQV